MGNAIVVGGVGKFFGLFRLLSTHCTTSDVFAKLRFLPPRNFSLPSPSYACEIAGPASWFVVSLGFWVRALVLSGSDGCTQGSSFWFAMLGGKSSLVLFVVLIGVLSIYLSSFSGRRVGMSFR
jgi:hypothetical protein